MAEAMVQAESLVKIYKTKETEVMALQGLDLTIERGELTAIIGNSGSGKSTFLNMIGGLDRPTVGSLQVCGRNLFTMTEKELVLYKRNTVGFVWQNNARNLLPYLSAVENVMLPMMFDDTPMGKIKQRALDALRQVEMEQLQGNKVATLSGGEKQRTAIARALVKNPEYILADEPTGALDTENAEIFMENLIHLHEMGKTIIMVTHDLELASRLNRTCRIVDGELIAE